MRDLRLATQFRRTERVDSAHQIKLASPPQGASCGKSVEQMRQETEAYLSRLFRREVKINVTSQP